MIKKSHEPGLRERALRCLARREYSRAELRTRLLHYIKAGEACEPHHTPMYSCGAKNVTPNFQEAESGASLRESHEDAVDALLDELNERGWLSDARAASQLLHARREGFGAQRIIHELHHKGIAETLIADLLPELKANELEVARRLWQKKFGTPPCDVREKARQVRFLQARGFGMEVILQVLRSGCESE